MNTSAAGLRFRPLARILAYTSLAAAVVTCDSPTAAGRPGVVALAPSLAPVFSQLQFSGLVVDQARITITRPPSEVIARQTFPFPPGSSQINASVSVLVQGGGESFDALIELLAAGAVVFSGTQQVFVVPGPPSSSTPPVQIPVSYTGPGRSVASLSISPASAAMGFGQTQQFTVSAVDSQQQAVASFYAGWRTSDPAHVIDAQGLLRAGNQRGSFWVVAQTPTGIRDSARVTVSPSASAVAAFSGGGQTGSVGTRLPLPIVARVTAADGGPVAGVTVDFDVPTGGGSVDSVSVVTDSLGLAGTTVVLGPNPGPNLYRATVGSLPRVTFTATGTSPVQPQIILAVPDTLVGVGFTQPLRVRIVPSAPAGGVVVNLVSDSTQYLTVGAPGSVTVPQGDSIRTINLTGVAAGLSRVRAAATGYPADSILVPVIPPVILVSPATASIGVGASATLTVSPRPRVSGSPLAVTMGTSAATVATVTPGTLNIPAGQFSGSVSVQGVGAGVAGITADAAGYTTGGASVTVSTGGVPTTLQIAAGNGQTAIVNDTVAVRPAVLVLDAGGAPVAGVQVLFAVTGGGGSVSVPTATTNASGVATLGGTSWRMGATPGTNTLAASLPVFPAVTAVTFTATAVPPPPVIALAIFGSNVVGQARTGQLNVRLLQAAPAGGVAVSLTTTRAGLLYIGSYGSESAIASFAQGDTIQAVAVYGDSLTTGVDTVLATAPGYTPDTLAVPVSINLISMPVVVNVPLSQNALVPVNLSVAAPAGGLQVAIRSLDPATASVLTDTVTIAQGSQVGSATINGAAIGTTFLSATNPNYAPFTSTVNVTAALNITATTVNLNASFGTPITVQLESGGLPVAAPAGGVPVTFTPRNPACAAAPNATIGQGFVNTAVTVTYGGTAPLPCSTYVVASGPAGFVIDSVNANVAVQPVISIGTTNIGAGLQRAVGLSLGASNHGGTAVQITSPDTNIVRLALNDFTPGSGTISVPVAINGTSANFYIQGVEGRIADTVILTATAPGFVSASPAVRVWQAIIDLVGVPTTANTLSGPSNVYVRVWTPSSPTGTQSQNDAIRAGGVAVTARISVTDSTVARLVDTVTAFSQADTAYVMVLPRQFNSPTTLATGGAQLQYLATGVDTVRAVAAGYRSVGTALNDVVTVSAPALTISTHNLGSGLQRQVSVSLSSPAPAGGVGVRLAAARTGVIAFAPDDQTPGVDTLVVTIPQGSSSRTFYIQALEGILADTVAYTATAVPPGFTAVTAGAASVRVWQAIIDLVGVPATATTLRGNDAIYARVWTPSSPTGTQSQNDAVRAGGTPVTVTFVTSQATVAQLETQTLAGSSVTATILPRQFNTPTSLGTGGVEINYLSTGTTSVTASSPVTRSVGTALTGQSVTVSPPVVTLSNTNVGMGLQLQTSGSLSASNHGGITVVVRSSNPAVALVSPNATTPGTDSIVLNVPNNQGSFSYFVQGVEGSAGGLINITASATGFTSGNATANVNPALFDVVNVLTSGISAATSPDDPFYVRTWSNGNPGGTPSLSQNQAVRAGGTALTVTITTSNPSVAQLVTSAGPQGGQATVQILPGQFNSPTTVASGGVAHDFLTAGTTNLTVSIPGLIWVGTQPIIVTVGP